MADVSNANDRHPLPVLEVDEEVRSFTSSLLPTVANYICSLSLVRCRRSKQTPAMAMICWSSFFPRP